ncbi:lanthionine synthetase C family protein [Ulvibacterium sp.]|uniref:lanthionine synthetase C family protein n=1 Tax=Ulvibacterium sp. TaxID=2665914 RepID=UPI003BA87D37
MIEDKLKEILQGIDDITKSKYSNENHVGVLVGLSGLSLFQFHYSRYKGNNEHSAIGTEILERIMGKINEGYNYPTFCDGICGAGWVLSHLDEKGFIELENEQLLADLDDFLYPIMVSDMRRKNYDFLHGAIGYALYFVNRYKNTKSKDLKQRYKTFLLRFIDLLNENSETEGNEKLKWISIQTRGELRDQYNLSLSHGMAGIIGILTKLCVHDNFRTLAKPMLTKAINYVLGYKKETKSFFLFPNLVSKNGEENVPSRLGWCYGDLGIGIRLWFASKALDDKILGDEALAILKHSAKRRTPEKTLLVDASLCHGSYGVALIFLRIYKETLDPIFKEAFEFWIQDGVNRAVQGNGYAGYKQWRHDDVWSEEVSLLEGISGIGLTIIDYLADFDTAWDECLMIS